jgi:hypothetical protein
MGLADSSEAIHRELDLCPHYREFVEFAQNAKAYFLKRQAYRSQRFCLALSEQT